MAKQPPAKQIKFNVGTLLLARNSKLFRPGAELILAAAPELKRKNAPKRAMKK